MRKKKERTPSLDGCFAPAKQKRDLFIADIKFPEEQGITLRRPPDTGVVCFNGKVKVKSRSWKVWQSRETVHFNKFKHRPCSIVQRAHGTLE